ncbi:MAG: PorT family protein [Ignavibacteriae bacterium]|nr:MAG: PorT family protein [Ignavibacteriota bacterium]
MTRVINILLVLFLTSAVFYSQEENKFGIKAGLVFSGMTKFNNDDVIKMTDEPSFFSFVGMDFGFYRQWFTTRAFSLSTEVHYNVKGEKNINLIALEPGSSGATFERKYLSNRFHYISFFLLPRYKFIRSGAGDNFYFFGGPSFDFLISNYYSVDNEPNLQVKNFGFGYGAEIGFGVEFMAVTCEFIYNHSFTGPYTFSYGSGKSRREYNSLEFIAGVALNSLFKKK